MNIIKLTLYKILHCPEYNSAGLRPLGSLYLILVLRFDFVDGVIVELAVLSARRVRVRVTLTQPLFDACTCGLTLLMV